MFLLICIDSRTPLTPLLNTAKHSFCLLLSCFYLVAQVSWGQGIFDLASPEFHKPISNSDGNARVTTFSQDDSGLIWLGTEKGLFYFDGYRYRAASFVNESGRQLPKAWITDITIDKQGILWLASYQEGLLRLDPENKTYIQHTHQADEKLSISSNRIARILPDSNGSLWLATDDGLNQFNLASQQFKRYPHPTHKKYAELANRTRELVLDRNNRLLVGSWNGIHYFDVNSKTFTPIFDRSDVHLNNKIVRKIIEDDQGRLWIGTYDDGLYVAQGDQNLKRLESDQRINDILQVDENNIWTTSLEQGISVYDTQSFERIQLYRHDPYNPASPSANYSRGLLLDKAGQVWVGTTDFGANRVDLDNRFSRTIFPSSSDPRQLSFKDVYSIAQLKNGKIWFGSSGNGIDVFDPKLGKIRSHRAEPGVPGKLQSNFITRITEHSQDGVWIGTAGNGLFHYDPKSNYFNHYMLPEDAAVNSVVYIIEDAEGNLVLSSGSSYFKFNLDTKHFENIEFAAENQLKINNVMAGSPNGDVWVASFNELAYLPSGENKLISVPLDNIKTSKPFRIQGINIYPDGEMILVTKDAIYRTEDVTTYAEGELKFELLADHNSQIENLFRRPNGDYWGATAFYDARHKQVFPLSKADGIYNRSQFLSSAIQTQSGALLFGGGFGVTVIRPEHFRKWDYQPSIVVTEIRLDGELYADSHQALSIPSTVSGFSIEYAALDYTAPGELKYQQRLLGYDEQWVNVSADDRKATYTNLAPGDYQLQVRATNRSGVWSNKQLTIPLTLEASWYQTWWAKLVLFLLIGIVIWLLFQWRLQQINVKRKQLASLVKQRTQELETSIRELHETQDQLVASQKNAALGRLVSGMAHELNTPMGVVKTGFSLVKEQARFAIEERSSSPLDMGLIKRKLNHLDKSCELVESNIEKMIALISNFKLVNADQDNPRPQRFMVMPMLEELLVPLRDKLKQAKVEVFITGEQNVYLNSLQGSLRHCLNEIIENALRHGFCKDLLSNDRRYIEIRVSRVSIEDKSQQISHWVVIRIRDNGEGIAAHLLENIFDPFVAAQANDTGLGLHIVYNTINLQMKGDISISSEDGTCIEIRLPSFHFDTQAVPKDVVQEPSRD